MEYRQPRSDRMFSENGLSMDSLLVSLDIFILGNVLHSQQQTKKHPKYMEILQQTDINYLVDCTCHR